MTAIDEIEKAVSRLSSEDLAKFREWFEEFDARVWDDKIEKDMKAGKLEKIAQEALVDFKQGRY